MEAILRNSIGFLMLLAGLAGSACAQAPARPAKVGDVHVYSTDQRTDRLRFDETVTVTGIEGGRIKTRHARSDRPEPIEGIYGADWAAVKSGTSGSQYEPAIPQLQHPLKVGAAWEGSYQLLSANGARSRLKMEYTVAAQEKVRTPAGEFDAFRIESKGYLSGVSWQGGFGIQQKNWYAPAIDRIVRTEYKEQRTMGADNVSELKQFKPAD
jgi:hypothetical protein